MTSTIEDAPSPEQGSSEASDNSDEDLTTSSDEFDKFLDYSDLKQAYDTVIEVYDGSPVLKDGGIQSLGDEVLVPSAEDYDSRGRSLEELADRLEGDTLVVAFGLSGEDLPGYLEISENGHVPEGNWWDNPEELDTDYLFDRETYSGAVNVPGYESKHLFSGQDFNREVFLISES